jgi:L-fucose isomerase
MADKKSMKMNPPQNRLIGGTPKIGVRPTIDGRLGGVRESLEWPNLWPNC